MRAIVWAAVSSKPQLKGDSLEAQIRDAEAACERFEWEVVAILRIPGQSRDFIFFQRAEQEVRAYREFRRLCERKAADVLVCRGRDRLGRSDALIAQVEALAKQAGMQIYSLAMPTAIIEPERAQEDRGILYAAAIERASAEAEMMELRRRHRMGMRARINRGLPSGSLPFGYRKNGVNPVPEQVPEECAVIREASRLYLKGWGMERIAARLNDTDAVSAKRVPWRSQMVYPFIRNPFYAGWVFWGDAMAPGKHEPIFTPEEWANLRAEINRRRRTRGKAALPYSGLVRCLVCGCSMSAQPTRKSLPSGERIYRYYRCGEGRARRVDHRPDAHHTMVRVDAIREAAIDKAKELEDPEKLEAACQDRLAEERASLQDQKAAVEDALSRLSGEVARLLEAHARWLTIGAKEFDELMGEAAERKKGLEQQLMAVTIKLEEMPPPDVRAAQLRELATDLATVLDSPDIEQANGWLAKRIRAIWCKNREVVRVELV